jgi:hypothetical protein
VALSHSDRRWRHRYRLGESIRDIPVHLRSLPETLAHYLP